MYTPEAREYHSGSNVLRCRTEAIVAGWDGADTITIQYGSSKKYSISVAEYWSAYGEVSPITIMHQLKV